MKRENNFHCVKRLQIFMPSTLFPLVRLVAMENIFVFKEIEQCFQVLTCCEKGDQFHKNIKFFMTYWLNIVAFITHQYHILHLISLYKVTRDKNVN